MPLEPDRPVVFLTFANAAEEGYLRQLKKESALLRDLFLPFHQRGQIELLREESLDVKELPRLLSQYKGRICIFHYGGHASQTQLSLEGHFGNAVGLGELLRLQNGIKLVFLNGCSTQAQAQPYLEAGVPVVIATTRSIADEEATFFAEHFYHALLNRHTIKEAFQAASGALKTRSSLYQHDAEEMVSFRRIGPHGEPPAEVPWRLYVQEENQNALNWSLCGELEQEFPNTSTGKSEKNLKQKIWSWILAAGVIVSLLVGLGELTGASFMKLGGSKKADSFSVTVLVHGKEGKDHRILRNQGKVTLDFGTTRQEASINEKGEATFKELPLRYLGQAALISIDHPQPYFPVERNAEYQLERGKSIYLEIELKGIDKIQGRVLDYQSEEPLGGVRVSYRDVYTFTDEVGWYQLNIPPDKQAKFIRVSFYKEGYRMESLDSIAPHTQQEIGISLKRK